MFFISIFFNKNKSFPDLIFIFMAIQDWSNIRIATTTYTIREVGTGYERLRLVVLIKITTTYNYNQRKNN